MWKSVGEQQKSTYFKIIFLKGFSGNRYILLEQVKVVTQNWGEERIIFAEGLVVKTNTFPFPNTISMLFFENQIEHFSQTPPEHCDI